MSLAQVFLAQAGPAAAARIGDLGRLEGVLTKMIETGRAAWPDVALAPEDLVRHAATCLMPDVEPLAGLASLHADDLYLACACAHGEPQAVAALETRFLSEVWTSLATSPVLRGLEARAPDEAPQRLRTRLLVGDAPSGPRILGYHGRGPLRAWLYMAAARMALELHRAERRPDELEELVRQLCGTAPDPELRYLQARYRPEVEAAFRDALAALPEREASLLRLHFVDGTTGEALARMYRVTRRTVHRWLAETRVAIIARMRQSLEDKLHLSAGEFESLVGLVQSHLDVSLQGLLRDSDDDSA